MTATPGTDTSGASPEPPVAGPGPAPTVLGGRDEPIVDWWVVVGLGVLLAVGALWLRSLDDLDPRDITELGLISVVPPTFFVAVALLTVGFVALVARPQPSRPLLAGYVGALAVVAHATPAVASGTLDNAWASANVGAVDAIQRTGALPADAGDLAAPTEWPGVHGFTAMVAEITAVNPATIAMWMPLAFTLVALLALAVLFQAITDDNRIVWTALWLFVLGNWLGQAHLSPLGFGFALGLAMLAIALPLDRIAGPEPFLPFNVGPGDGTVGSLAATVVLLGLLGVTVVVSDQLTPLVLAALFAVAAATRTSRTVWLAVGMAVAALAWLAGPARSFVDGDLLRVFEPLGSPSQFALTTTRGLDELTSGAQAVLIAGRFVAQAIVLLAVVGVAIRFLRGRRVGMILGALAVPAVIVVAAPEIESVLRAVLFALPWLALAGASTLVWLASHRRTTAGTMLGALIVGALTVGFLVAQSGERGAGFFTAGEVELVDWLSRAAPDDTLVIEGSANAPGATSFVEHITRVPLAGEPRDVVAAVADDPAGALHERMVRARSEGFAAAFVVITRSQQHGELIAPRLPDGLLGEVEADLRASAQFTIVGENADAVVFALSEGGT